MQILWKSCLCSFLTSFSHILTLTPVQPFYQNYSYGSQCQPLQCQIFWPILISHLFNLHLTMHLTKSSLKSSYFLASMTPYSPVFPLTSLLIPSSFFLLDTSHFSDQQMLKSNVQFIMSKIELVFLFQTCTPGQKTRVIFDSVPFPHPVYQQILALVPIKHVKTLNPF